MSAVEQEARRIIAAVYGERSAAVIDALRRAGYEITPISEPQSTDHALDEVVADLQGALANLRTSTAEIQKAIGDHT